MNRVDLKDAVETATAQVMESMFYLSSDGPSVFEIAETDLAIQRELDFKQPEPGTFGIGATSANARTFAANFLGDEPDQVDESTAGEIFGEMANMICGSLLARLQPSNPVELSSPRKGSADTAMLASARMLRCFSFEGKSLTVWIR